MSKHITDKVKALQIQTKLRIQSQTKEVLQPDTYRHAFPDEVEQMLLGELLVVQALVDALKVRYKKHNFGGEHADLDSTIKGITKAVKDRKLSIEATIEATNDFIAGIWSSHAYTAILAVEAEAAAERDGNALQATSLLQAYTDYTYLLATDGKLMVLTDEPTKAKYFKDYHYKNLYSLLPHAAAVTAAKNIPFTTVNAKGDSVKGNVCDAWTESVDRRTLNGITFDPSSDARIVRGEYNIWRGWRDWGQPIEGADAAFWELARDVICDGNEAYYQFVRKWLAHLVQKPAERPLCALGISGPQGYGKSVFVKAIGKLLHDSHYNPNVSMQAITGNQQGRDLEGVLVAYVDEATWGGDKTSTGALKKAITGETDRINEKFVPAYNVPTYKRVIFSSNEKYYYHADADDRRLLPLEVNPDKPKKSPEFFQRIFNGQEPRPEVQAALLQTLRSIDIQGWVPYVELSKLEIVTGADMMHRSMSNVQQWLKQSIDDGYFEYKITGEDRIQYVTQWDKERVSVMTLKDSYAHYCSFNSFDKTRMVNLSSPEAVDELRKIFGSPAKSIRVGGKVTKGYDVDWAVLRSNFEARFNWKITWDTPLPETAQTAAAPKVLNFDEARTKLNTKKRDLAELASVLKTAAED